MSPWAEPKPGPSPARRARDPRPGRGRRLRGAGPARRRKLAAADGIRVAGGFIELSSPALREAVADLVAAPGPIVAIPIMLSAAGHAKGDIPAALARERLVTAA